MKLLLALLLLPVTVFATGSQITASGGSPIPTAFSASNAQSQIQECQGNVIEIMNETSSKLAVGFAPSSSAPTSDFKYVPSGPLSWTVIKPKGGFSSGTYVYLRSASGSTVTSGSVTVSCTYED